MSGRGTESSGEIYLRRAAEVIDLADRFAGSAMREELLKVAAEWRRLGYAALEKEKAARDGASQPGEPAAD